MPPKPPRNSPTAPAPARTAEPAKPLEFTAAEPAALLAFLFEAMPDRSKTTVKSYLSHRQVSVNGKPSTQFDHPLRPGDLVTVSFGRMARQFSHPQLRIVFEDPYLVVVEKKNGLLSVATDKQVMKTALSLLSEYVKETDPQNKIFVLHRLDRETSGLMFFAKDEQLKRHIQENWTSVVVERKYYAVAEGLVQDDEGTISTYLTESKALKVYATTQQNGKIANTHFRVLKRSPKLRLTLLELELETGRKNQIRAHLEYIGHPIVGDKKYGSKQALIGRVALHAGVLSFIHPVTGERHDFSTPIPSKFTGLFDGKTKTEQR